MTNPSKRATMATYFVALFFSCGSLPKTLCRLALILGISIFSSEAHARSLVGFSLDRLISASDLILTGKISDIEVSVSTEFVMTHQANVTRAIAKIDPIRIFYSTHALSNPIIVAHQDSDYFSGPLPAGTASQPYKKGQTYLLFLKMRPDGYHALQLYQGIAPINGTMVKAYFGTADRAQIEKFFELRFAAATTTEQWDRFGSTLIAQADLNDAEKTVATFQMLFSLPNPNQYEPILIKGLDSKNSSVVTVSMRHLADLGSENGIKEIADLYFRIKKTGGWKTYRPQYILPYQFKSILMDWKAPATILRLKKLYPDEPDLFDY